MIPVLAHRLTGKTIHFGSLMFGDRFRFVGDLEGTGYGPVVRTQDYVDGSTSVYVVGGGEFYGGIFKGVVLLHRAPDCECGRHVDLCENDCEWPAELEALWSSCYTD